MRWYVIPELTPWAAAVVIVIAAVVIVTAGPRMVTVADRLADVTGLGEALIGAVLVGAATSLPDLLATATPALSGLPDLAIGNALGGVLGQTAFLAAIDLTYRRANLEHAAASLPNIVQAGLLITLLAAVLLLFHVPTITIANVHIGTFSLPLIYLYGLRLVHETGDAPMWRPTTTDETREDVPDEPQGRGPRFRALVLQFLIYGALLVAAGYALARAGESLVGTTGLSQTAVGVFLTGVASSSAELVVGIAAVRRGALTLAVGNVIGGNMFDTLLVGVADVMYRGGSVYAAASEVHTVYVGLALLMTAAALLGLLRRERHGVANIGMESAAILILYLLGIVLIF